MSAPFVSGSDTSRAAAESVEESLENLRTLVLKRIRRSGKRGMTCDEVEVQLDLRHQTASARVRELFVKGQIIDSGERRTTRSGRAAVVWVAR